MNASKGKFNDHASDSLSQLTETPQTQDETIYAELTQETIASIDMLLNTTPPTTPTQPPTTDDETNTAHIAQYNDKSSPHDTTTNTATPTTQLPTKTYIATILNIEHTYLGPNSAHRTPRQTADNTVHINKANTPNKHNTNITK